jgi:predicted nucleotidyltransferase
MEQNGYNFLKSKVLIWISKHPSHIRELALKFKVNHMKIKRLLEELYNRNILDFKFEGKNKKYFLKNNFESRNEILVSELDLQANIIEAFPILREIFEKIVSHEKIKLSILFGSYAKSTPLKSSDIDIYIETSSNGLKDEIEKINSKISVKIGTFNKNSLLMKEIIENHIIIKGFEDYYDKAN